MFQPPMSYGQSSSCLDLVKQALKQIDPDVKFEEKKIGKTKVLKVENLIIGCGKLKGAAGYAERTDQADIIKIDPQKVKNLRDMKITLKHELVHISLYDDGKKNGFLHPVHGSNLKKIWFEFRHCHEVIAHAEGLKYIQSLQDEFPDLHDSKVFWESIETMKEELVECQSVLKKYEGNGKHWQSTVENLKNQIKSLKKVIMEKSFLEADRNGKVTTSEKRYLKAFKDWLELGDTEYREILNELNKEISDKYSLSVPACSQSFEQEPALLITKKNMNATSQLIIENIGTTSVSQIYLEGDLQKVEPISNKNWIVEHTADATLLIPMTEILNPGEYSTLEIALQPDNHLHWYVGDSSNSCDAQGFVHSVDEFDILAVDTSPIIDLGVSLESLDSAKIPDWVRTVAGWWSEKKISDQEFIRGMEYLIEIRVLRVY